MNTVRNPRVFVYINTFLPARPQNVSPYLFVQRLYSMKEEMKGLLVSDLVMARPAFSLTYREGLLTNEFSLLAKRIFFFFSYKTVLVKKSPVLMIYIKWEINYMVHCSKDVYCARQLKKNLVWPAFFIYTRHFM